MNPPKFADYAYINFKVAAQPAFSAVDATDSHPESDRQPAHDAHTRLLQRMPPNSEALWTRVQLRTDHTKSLLVIDGTTLDKLYASHMARVSNHWSGKHHAIVQGINLVSLVWSDGDACLPCDYRIYYKAQDSLRKNDHLRIMLEQVRVRCFQPALVIFDSWSSSLENLKLMRDLGRNWQTRLKSNRQVSLRPGEQRALGDQVIPAGGLFVHLRRHGQIWAFRMVDPHGNADHWATDRVQMTKAQRQVLANRAWLVEVYRRALVHFTGIERVHFRLERAQRNHIGLALRAYLRLEYHRWSTRVSIINRKLNIIRTTLALYLAHPRFDLLSTAQLY